MDSSNNQAHEITKDTLSNERRTPSKEKNQDEKKSVLKNHQTQEEKKDSTDSRGEGS